MKNPAEFWKTFPLLHEDTNSKMNKSCPISAKEWVAHFSKLMEGAVNNSSSLDQAKQFQTYIESNKDQIFNELNFRISQVEVRDAIKRLKLNKAPGLDGISNEMLKACPSTLADSLSKLFNVILNSGIFLMVGVKIFLRQYIREVHVD